ncbi:unnamed protein product, partial [marine sediment metagenome]
KDKIKIEIKSRDIPPDIYDYLKKAKSEEDIEALADKVIFYERPYLKIGIPQLKDLANGKIQVTLSIDRYVLMDIPVSHISKKGQSDHSSLMKLAKDNFAVLIVHYYQVGIFREEIEDDFTSRLFFNILACEFCPQILSGRLKPELLPVCDINKGAVRRSGIWLNILGFKGLKMKTFSPS